MIPTPTECYALLKAYRVPEHIIQHSREVRRLALILCQELTLQGERLNQAAVEAGSLLHDIAKMEGLRSGENHAQAGARLLRDLGFPEVAEIVRQHVVLDREKPPHPITEAMIVHYADKRVRHTTVVSLAERFQDLKERYGKNPVSLAWLEDLERNSLGVEKRILERLSPASASLIFRPPATFPREMEPPPENSESRDR
jgi:putative nucleotidyltransferase with HDIG domain